MTLLLLVTKPDMRQKAKAKGLSNGLVSNKCQKQVFNDLTFITIQVWMILLLCIDTLKYSYNIFDMPGLQFNWITKSPNLTICLCLTTFSASRASQFRTDKVSPRFFDDLMKQKWSGRIFCKNDYHKWLDSKSFEAHWKWKCFYVFKISSSRVVDSVWFDNNILKLVR